MIEVLGSHEPSNEVDAANDMRDMILQEWPDLEGDPDRRIWLVPQAKTYGQKVQDVDLLLLCSFPAPLDWDVQPYGIRVRVVSFCLALEVKSHDKDGVIFEGGKLYVRYGESLHDASQQSDDQIYAVRGYIQQEKRRHNARLAVPWVTGGIWLRNIDSSDLPRQTHNILGRDATWSSVLHLLAVSQAGRTSTSISRGSTIRIQATSAEGASTFPAAAQLFTARLQATRLDRQRVERICKRVSDRAQYWSKLGTQLLVFRGRGGAGKTMMLLRLANHLYQEQRARILILTYNKALAADIRRLLTIMGIGSGLAMQHIEIQTVHAYVNAILRALGLISPQDDDYYRCYSNYLEQARERCSRGLRGAREAGSGAFAWDYLLIDEAQDWPDAERDLLYTLFPKTRFVLADGIDQLVRSAHHADWLPDDLSVERQIVHLDKLLRLKHGLYRFVTAFAEELGIQDWEVEPNREAPGGRVVIVSGAYRADSQLHRDLIQANAADHNEPVDMLFCVPPALVRNGRSLLGVELEEKGYAVWDGADVGVRDSYPTELDQLRIVQYESCRGLEGWVVVCLAFDDFYNHKLKHLEPAPEEVGQLYFDRQAWARQAAARWLMIPMTRAIDTLVIQIGSRESPIGQALWRVARKHGEVVQWITAA